MSEQHPNRRERQAGETRAEILRSARRLFAQRGYAATSVREIAKDAGVSPQTVYDSLGSKQALVARLNDLIDEEAGIAAIVASAMESGDPQVIVASQAKVMRSILEHCGDILHALLTGAAAEPDLAAVLAEGHRRHVFGTRQLIRALDERGALADSKKGTEAADVLAALTDVRFGVLLRDTYGWSLDRIERWVTSTMSELLLPPA